MEVNRQEGDLQTNGEIDQMESKSDDSSKHMINESVSDSRCSSIPINIIL